MQHALTSDRETRHASTVWVTTLLDQPGLTDQQIASLGHRFNFDLSDALAVAADLATRRSLLDAARTALQRLADSDPLHAAWQRDLWVSYWRIANLLEQQQSSDAITYWRKAHDTLAAMEKAGLFVSPEDQQFLIRLRQKIGS